MAFTLPELPYPKSALAPHISAETLEFHYGKHHMGYLTKLNAQLEASPALASKSLEDLITTQTGGVFNLAAQIWNHTFYWRSLKPGGGGAPTGRIAQAIDKSFGSFAEFRQKFSGVAAGHFGSGWAWLGSEGGNLKIVDTHDAGCPLTSGLKPVLTCDVWEHAYYIDYRNDRARYIESWWNLVNWDFASSNL
jgi:Fe-Mn family superoxide dismutase